ncbi:MAG: hypothetical protein ACJATE_001412 [Bacteroidia bacterium]|jgi:hypothetical protein
MNILQFTEHFPTEDSFKEHFRAQGEHEGIKCKRCARAAPLLAQGQVSMAMQWMRFPHHIEEQQHHGRLEGQCPHLISGHGLHEFQQEGHLSRRASRAAEPPQVR